MSEPESIAQEAHRIVLGDRGADYGHPIFDMTRTADMLTALLRDKLRPGQRLEAEDIATCMVCVKQSRHRNKPKRDNLVDMAGYALTLDMIKEWRIANPGVDPRDVFPPAPVPSAIRPESSAGLAAGDAGSGESSSSKLPG
jgi:hypothetical protein